MKIIYTTLLLAICVIFLSCSTTYQHSSEVAAQGIEDIFLDHKVTYQGETLGIISKWYTGKVGNWIIIKNANPTLNERRIKIGDTIRIPKDLLITDKKMPKAFIEKFILSKSSVAKNKGKSNKEKQDIKKSQIKKKERKTDFQLKQRQEKEEKVKVIKKQKSDSKIVDSKKVVKGDKGFKDSDMSLKQATPLPTAKNTPKNSKEDSLDSRKKLWHELFEKP